MYRHRPAECLSRYHNSLIQGELLARHCQLFQGGQRERLYLTGGRAVRYFQNRGQSRAFQQRDAVCLCRVLWGTIREPFRGRRNNPSTGHRPKDARNGKAAAEFLLVEAAEQKAYSAAWSRTPNWHESNDAQLLPFEDNADDRRRRRRKTKTDSRVHGD